MYKINYLYIIKCINVNLFNIVYILSLITYLLLLSIKNNDTVHSTYKNIIPSFIKLFLI